MPIPGREDIKDIARRLGYGGRHPEESKTLFFAKLSDDSSLIDVSYTTGSIELGNRDLSELVDSWDDDWDEEAGIMDSSYYDFSPHLKTITFTKNLSNHDKRGIAKIQNHPDDYRWLSGSLYYYS